MVIPPFIRSQDFPARWMLRTGHGRDLFSRVKRLSKTEYQHGFVQNMRYTVYTVNQPWIGNWLRNPHHGTRSTFTPCTCYIKLKHPDIICNWMFWICFRIPRHKIILYIYTVDIMIQPRCLKLEGETFRCQGLILCTSEQGGGESFAAGILNHLLWGSAIFTGRRLGFNMF